MLVSCVPSQDQVSPNLLQPESYSVSNAIPSHDEFDSADYAPKNFVSPADAARMKRLSVSQVSTYRWSLDEELEALQTAQIPAIGLWRPKFSEWGDEHGIELLKQSNVKVSSVSWAGGFTGSHGFSYNEAIADSCEAIELARQVGAKSVMVATGARYGHTKNHAHRLVVEGLKYLSDYAGERGVSLAVVPMAARQAVKWTYLTTLNQALDVVFHCNRDNVGLGVDLAHLSNKEMLIDRIADIAMHTKMVRLNDCRPESVPGLLSCCPVGEGEFALDEVITRFTQHGYEGFFEFEVRSEQVWEQAEYHQLLQSCREMFVQSVLVSG